MSPGLSAGPSFGNSSPFHASPSPHRFGSPAAPSAKRTKSTPSPVESTLLNSSTGSSRNRSRPSARRPALEPRRGVSFEPIAETSAGVRFGVGRNELETRERRREMSVPMLSQTLSSCSLSNSTPTGDASPSDRTPVSIPFHIPSPSPHTTMTPRRPTITPLQSRLGEQLPRSHIYPATAPLPDMPSFLGSPFSTKTARGAYDYRSFSPSKTAATDHIGQSNFFAKLDWMEGSEWHVEELLADDTHPETDAVIGMGSPLRASRPRRDTSSSASSIDESSGTSSSSLYSLARDPVQQRATSRKMSSWGEQSEYEVDDEGETTTPHLYRLQSEAEVDCIVDGSSRSRCDPDVSPLTARSGKAKTKNADISPFQAFFMARTPSQSSPARDAVSPLFAKARSPLAFLPRPLSSKKPTPPLPALSTSRSAVRALTFDIAEPSAQPLVASLPPPSNSSSDSATVGLGIGLGLSNASRRTEQLAHSFSSDSEESSPSKPPVTRSKASVSPLGPSRLPRRKTIGGNAKRSSPVIKREKALRPSLRRGITEPKTANGGHNANLLSLAHANMSTPVALFANIRPSPAAFSSTGLIKKKSSVHVDPPRFGDSEPPKKPAMISPVKPIKSRLAMMTKASDLSDSSRSGTNGTDASVSVYTRAGPKTRGLRRKTSSMFVPSGSSSNTNDSDEKSPVTPTKGGLGLRMLPINRAITTPSPTTPTHVNYPFAPSSSFKPIVSPFAPSSPVDLCSPIRQTGAAARHAMARQAPLARSSNPMLASTFRAQANAAELVAVPGNRLETVFTIEKSLGQGEFSNVWEVRDRRTGQLFAVKAGRPYTGAKNRLRQLEEISILHELSREPHPHIIPYIDSWEHNSRLYIQTALAPCGDLSTFLLIFAESGGIGEARVWKVMYELASGLAHIHGNNFLHLDLKPSNILITSAGSLQIADFGMSTVLTSAGGVGGVSPALPTAVDGSFVWEEGASASVPVPSPIIDRELEGDREYLCPETMEGTVGKGADMYSLGILLLEAAVNVVLPPNGDAWIKLRNDDYSDLPEHYTPREGWSTMDKHENAEGEPLPVLSGRILDVIKGLMLSDPGKRMTLEEVMGTKEMIRIEGWKIAERSGGRKVKPALEEEGAEEDWIAALTG